jgi:hypothetical protein
VSNKFITWDVSTSDLARQVHPNVEGLMMALETSPDNRFVAAYTNNNQERDLSKRKQSAFDVKSKPPTKNAVPKNYVVGQCLTEQHTHFQE